MLVDNSEIAVDGARICTAAQALVSAVLSITRVFAHREHSGGTVEISWAGSYRWMMEFVLRRRKVTRWSVTVMVP